MNGTDGIKMVKENGFKLAIIDLVLPDIDGVEVCKEIKEAKPEVKTILMSGHLNKLDARKEDFISVGGCKQVIEKPFEKGKLVGVAKGVFEKGAGC